MNWKGLIVVLSIIGALWLLRKSNVDWGEMQVMAILVVGYGVIRGIAEAGDQILSKLEEISEKLEPEP